MRAGPRAVSLDAAAHHQEPVSQAMIKQMSYAHFAIAARVAKLPTSAVLRAQAIGEKQGLMKVLVGANDDRILGFTMIGSEAGEVMAVVQTAMIAGLPYSMLRDAVLTHPTGRRDWVSS
jgi:pyruvate/2-oxoglutarate dehydrogenase complex dihydrolipoamide dehydrogenase (E3) component